MYHDGIILLATSEAVDSMHAAEQKQHQTIMV
jgi:hypothetical protein